jgi:hypothetical protein
MTWELSRWHSGDQSVGSHGSDDDVNWQAYELGCKGREAVDSAFGVSVLNPDVLSVNPIVVAEALPKCLVPGRGIRGRKGR